MPCMTNMSSCWWNLHHRCYRLSGRALLWEHMSTSAVATQWHRICWDGGWREMSHGGPPRCHKICVMELIDSLVLFQIKNSTSVSEVWLCRLARQNCDVYVKSGAVATLLLFHLRSYLTVFWTFEHWFLFAAIFHQSLSLLISMIFRLRSTLDRASFSIIGLPSHTLYSWEDGHPPQALDVIYKMALTCVLNRVDLLHPSAIHVATSEPVTHHCDLYEPVGRHTRRRFYRILSTYKTLPGKTLRYHLFHIVQQEFQEFHCHSLSVWLVQKIKKSLNEMLR